METPAPGGFNYNDPNNPFNVKDLPGFETQENKLSLREKAVVDILKVVDGGQYEIDQYQHSHMEKLRSHYVELLGKEQEVLRQAALRPEERTRAQDAPMS